ncbi:hypothetical protein ACIMS1_004438 [Vibrio harveyi]
MKFKKTILSSLTAYVLSSGTLAYAGIDYPVTLYSENNFSGEELKLSANEESLVRIFNDKLSSIKIKKGWQVDLYEHGLFQGNHITLTEDATTLPNFDNRASSIKVREIGKINFLPEVESIPFQRIDIESNYSFSLQVVASDKNTDDKLKYSLERNSSAFSINPETGLITAELNENTLGDFNFYVKVEDGKEYTRIPVKGKVIHNGDLDTTFIDKKYSQVSINMMLPKALELTTYVESTKILEQKDFVGLGDIEVYTDNGNIIVKNETFQPIDKLLVKVNDTDSPYLLNLSEPIPKYSESILTTNNKIKKVELIDNLTMFRPYVNLGGVKTDCSDKTKTCYNSAESGNERENFERTLSYINKLMNEVDFRSQTLTYIEDNCRSFYDCTKHYETEKDISYSQLQYLRLAHEDHSLQMEVMRNHYIAEGVGSGYYPSLDLMQSSSRGIASIWENYIDETRNEYRILPINTLFHEIGHAYGFSHASGFSYGIPDKIAVSYVNDKGYNKGITPSYTVPSIGVTLSLKSENKISLNLYDIASSLSEKSVNFNITSTQPLDYTINNTFGSNQVEIKFNKVSSSPVFIQIWGDGDQLISTLKYKPDQKYACVYDEINQKGNELCFVENNTSNSFTTKQKSIKAFNGAKLDTYSGIDLTGKKKTISNIGNLDFHSFKFSPYMCIYTHGNYGGNEHCYYEDQNILVPNDDASSLKLFNDAEITVYQHYNYDGNSKVFATNQSHLQGWNDAISSFSFNNQEVEKEEILPDEHHLTNGMLPEESFLINYQNSGEFNIKLSKERNLYAVVPSPTIFGAKQVDQDNNNLDTTLSAFVIEDGIMIPKQIKFRFSKEILNDSYAINKPVAIEGNTKFVIKLLEEDNMNLSKGDYTINFLVNFHDHNDPTFELNKLVTLNISI